MVIAMVAMRMVQVVSHEIINMVAMRYRFVAAAGSVNVPGFMFSAHVSLRANGRPAVVDLKFVLVNMIAMRVVQVSIMQVADMLIMADCLVAAAGTMLVIVVGMCFMCAAAHWASPEK
jgi:hypothetical protein